MTPPTPEQRTWNWCHKCQQPVDVEPDSFDGTEHRCWGCGRWFVLVVYGDDLCGLYSERQQRSMRDRGKAVQS